MRSLMSRSLWERVFSPKKPLVDEQDSLPKPRDAARTRNVVRRKRLSRRALRRSERVLGSNPLPRC